MRYIAFVFSFLFLLFQSAQKTSAHVAYVLPQDTLATHAGRDFPFFFSPLLTINYVVIIACFVLMIYAIYWLGHHVPLFLKETSYVKKRLINYDDIIPWILRLGLGILFIGAAFHHAFVNPIVTDIGNLAAYELIAGFCLLLGFLVTPSLLVIIAFYFVALFQNGYMFGSLEVLGSAIAILLLANSRPGFDDILGIPTLLRNRMAKYVPLILRISMGSGFIFLAFYEKIFNPHYFATLVENYHLTSLIPVSPAMWTFSVGAIELIIGLCILFGFKTRISAAIAFFVAICTFFFFKEDIYAHAAIFAVLSVLFITGGGHWSIDEHIEHAHRTKSSPRPARKIAARKKPAARKTARKKASA